MIKHLDDVGMGYSEHLVFAIKILWRLQGACWALLIHAVCPWWFEKTASNIIKKLAKDFQTH